MQGLVISIAVVFLCGLLAFGIRLPPLVGFLAAGFILHAIGIEKPEELEFLADIGVTLMLFAIGLRLDVRSIFHKEVWASTGIHMLIMTGVGALFLSLLSVIGLMGPESWETLAVVSLLLSFSSTIIVVKILQDRGDEQSLYGTMCIGVLIIQDIVAVVVISISRGSAPSPWVLSLIFIVPLLMFITKNWHQLGHGELGALFGIAMALIPGWALFEWVGLSGSLGALAMGLILAPQPGSNDLARTLFTVKELLLVGFFVNIGFAALPSLESIELGLALLLLLPLQAFAYWLIFWLFGMRNRTSVLASLLLSNYSEFALIIAALGVSSGWLGPEWIDVFVIAVAASFVLTSILNPRSVSMASRFAARLPQRPPHRIHPDDRPIHIGDATAIVLGVGRVGKMAYEQLTEEHGYNVLGIEHDHLRVHALQEAGFNVVEGDATDQDFWTRVVRNGKIRIILLAMPSQHANTDALKEIRRIGYKNGTIAAIALFREDVDELRGLGIDVIVHLYAGAGESLADRAAEAESSFDPPEAPTDPHSVTP